MLEHLIKQVNVLNVLKKDGFVRDKYQPIQKTAVRQTLD